jgi:GT2 family glycosyltransferase
MALSLTVIIPTKNRACAIQALLASMRELLGMERSQPQIIVADNGSQDETWEFLQNITKDFPVPLVPLRVSRPGKSAAINRALQVAKGDILAFLDDDVVVDAQWLGSIEGFLECGNYRVGQGRILLQSPASEDPAIQELMNRYRTVPYLNFSPEIKEIHSINGANFIISRDILQSLGGFDERLGPGASGTSEDVELAQRIRRAGYRIGYMRDATVYHSVERRRLTEEYFASVHRRQGHSRFLMKPRTTAHILFNLGRASIRYALFSLTGQERKRYRNKGRMHHYRGMLEAKRLAPRQVK